MPFNRSVGWQEIIIACVRNELSVFAASISAQEKLVNITFQPNLIIKTTRVIPKDIIYGVRYNNLTHSYNL